MNNAEEFDFSQNQLNGLGYRYLNNEELQKAMVIFELNAEVNPNSASVYASFGEALLKNDAKEKAIENYKKSLELNPGNQNAIEKLKELGVNSEDLVKAIVVDKKVLETYVGKYELAPNFILTVSLEANQLMAQATGQPQFSV